MEVFVHLCEEWVGKAGGGGYHAMGTEAQREESLEFRVERDRIVVAFPSR